MEEVGNSAGRRKTSECDLISHRAPCPARIFIDSIVALTCLIMTTNLDLITP